MTSLPVFCVWGCFPCRYVIDTATAILSILLNGKTGEAYNVSNDQSICSIREFACAVAEASNRKVVMDLPNATEAKGFSKPQNCILDNTKLVLDHLLKN